MSSPVQRRLEAEAQLTAKPAAARAIAPEGAVRLPHSGKRGALTWLKLVESVDQSKPAGFAFEGRILRPGGELGRHDIPEPCVLLECAGPVGPGRGHNRAEVLYLLWRWDVADWREIARAASVGAEWVQDLAPIALRALSARKGMAVAVDAETVALRVIEVLESGLAQLSEKGKGEALGIIHDQIVGRLGRF